MNDWQDQLAVDPLPPLLAADNAALNYFVRRDLLEEPAERVETLWQLPEPQRILRRQGADGAWSSRSRVQDKYPSINYHLTETFRHLRLLVAKYGFYREHEAIRRAAAYLFSCQTAEGDIRGILGTQYMPYYFGAILELLVRAGYADDSRLEKGLAWLLSMRQEDGGWIVPLQAVPAKDKTGAIWSAPPIAPDRQRPFSHLATGMALRAFAVHPTHRYGPEAQHAGRLLASRLLQADKYNDRKGPEYWTKFQYPFWWSNLLTALDSLSLMGFPAGDADIQRGLAWFVENQGDDGLWRAAYGKAEDVELWVTLAVCRVFRQFGGDRPSQDLTAARLA